MTDEGTPLVVWVIVREERHYQTNETQSLRIVEAVTGTNPQAVHEHAERRVTEMETADDACDGTYRCPMYWPEQAETVATIADTTEEDE